MLVMIVVSAATVFGSFAIKAREEAGEAKLMEAQREAERLDIIGITLDPPTGSAFDGWTFHVLNVRDGDARLVNLRINGHAVTHFTMHVAGGVDTDADGLWDDWEHTHFDDLASAHSTSNADGGATMDLEEMLAGTDPQDGSDDGPVDRTPGYEVVLPARREMLIHVDDDAHPGTLQGLDLAEPITVELRSGLLNTFERSFVGPTALGFPVETSASNLLLDGSSSDHPGEGGRIVKWLWTFNSDTSAATSANGRIVDSGIDCDGVTGAANREIVGLRLTVTDQFGMQGTVDLGDHDC